MFKACRTVHNGKCILCLETSACGGSMTQWLVCVTIFVITIQLIICDQYEFMYQQFINVPLLTSTALLAPPHNNTRALLHTFSGLTIAYNVILTAHVITCNHTLLSNLQSEPFVLTSNSSRLAWRHTTNRPP